jgi:hypothetical protein
MHHTLVHIGDPIMPPTIAPTRARYGLAIQAYIRRLHWGMGRGQISAADHIGGGHMPWIGRKKIRSRVACYDERDQGEGTSPARVRLGTRAAVLLGLPRGFAIQQAVVRSCSGAVREWSFPDAHVVMSCSSPAS